MRGRGKCRHVWALPLWKQNAPYVSPPPTTLPGRGDILRMAPGEQTQVPSLAQVTWVSFDKRCVTLFPQNRNGMRHRHLQNYCDIKQNDVSERPDGGLARKEHLDRRRKTCPARGQLTGLPPPPKACVAHARLSSGEDSVPKRLQVGQLTAGVPRGSLQGVWFWKFSYTWNFPGSQGSPSIPPASVSHGPTGGAQRSPQGLSS